LNTTYGLMVSIFGIHKQFASVPWAFYNYP
jgi:hypothetical protein